MAAAVVVTDRRSTEQAHDDVGVVCCASGTSSYDAVVIYTTGQVQMTSSFFSDGVLDRIVPYVDPI